MKKLYRRSFVKQFFTGVAGTVLLSSYKPSDTDYPVELLKQMMIAKPFGKT